MAKIVCLARKFLLPLIFEFLLWLIYDLNIIPNGNFDTDFLPIISFIKIFVAEKVAKSFVEWCQVVVCYAYILQKVIVFSVS